MYNRTLPLLEHDLLLLVNGARHTSEAKRLKELEKENAPLPRDPLQKRNHSILAHGLEPMNGKAAARFLEYVDAIVDVPEARIGSEHATLRAL